MLLGASKIKFLLAPITDLLAPGKRAGLNVKPCTHVTLWMEDLFLIKTFIVPFLRHITPNMAHCLFNIKLVV